jgi:hypothetical protein
VTVIRRIKVETPCSRCDSLYRIDNGAQCADCRAVQHQLVAVTPRVEKSQGIAIFADKPEIKSTLVPLKKKLRKRKLWPKDWHGWCAEMSSFLEQLEYAESIRRCQDIRSLQASFELIHRTYVKLGADPVVVTQIEKMISTLQRASNGTWF